ncbi:hypothetical protein PMO31116_02334 [Pandoraea morbifera]|uniref:Uncharacterized protein n=1 Tax=Pandoraea morbifera TaxID=2508300 RepID=A0A5E4V2T6_9BURK|nr:hypothetical protein PMO31116_02334 [Pandoraea morbifera]
MQKNLSMPRMLRLAPLTLLMTGCASSLPNIQLPRDIPPLPAEARQPTAEQIPSICSQGCSAGLTKLRETSLSSLTLRTSPASPANEAMMR